MSDEKRTLTPWTCKICYVGAKIYYILTNGTTKLTLDDNAEVALQIGDALNNYDRLQSSLAQLKKENEELRDKLSKQNLAILNHLADKTKLNDQLATL